jgi:hypothetical protein
MRSIFMSRIQALLAAVFLGIAVFVFAVADGPRRIYSGGLFAVLGVVLLINTRRNSRPRSE